LASPLQVEISMSRLPFTRLLPVALAMAIAIALGACGTGGAGRAGGSITILESAFPDSLDPAFALSAARRISRPRSSA